MSADTRSHRSINLRPAVGDRFQPTGFPDLGAALFQRPKGTDEWQACLHVESPQSMANRLEAATWDEAENRPAPELADLPYVRVVDAAGEFITSSRVEPHRLASAYVMDGEVSGTGKKGVEWLPGRLGLEAGKPLDHRRLARAVYELDPLSLVHGVFFAQNRGGGWPRQPRIARAVTAFIDATDVMEAVSGGVKTDYVDTAGGHTDTGYGMVPHSRIEYTARAITAYVTVDHEQIRAYGLGEAETELIESIIAFELASLFDSGGLRLRTACEFVVDSQHPGEGQALPALEEARTRLAAATAAARETFGEVTTVVHAPGGKGSRKKKTEAQG